MATPLSVLCVQRDQAAIALAAAQSAYQHAVLVHSQRVAVRHAPIIPAAVDTTPVRLLSEKMLASEKRRSVAEVEANRCEAAYVEDAQRLARAREIVDAARTVLDEKNAA